MKNSLRTNLRKAKGLWSVTSGVHHWWHQRLTSIIMIQLFFWLIFFIKCNSGKKLSTILENMHKIYNIVPMMIFLPTAFYHGMLGMQVIIEDYISNMGIRTFLIILTQLFCFITIISMLVALLLMITIFKKRHYVKIIQYYYT